MDTPIDRTTLESRLRQRRLTLRGEIRATLLRADAERYANIADRMGDVEDRSLAELLADVSQAEIQRDLGEIADINQALQRVSAGTYGVCIVCHDAIPITRLAAFPTAKRCVRCQQAHEQQKK